MDRKLRGVEPADVVLTALGTAVTISASRGAQSTYSRYKLVYTQSRLTSSLVIVLATLPRYTGEFHYSTSFFLFGRTFSRVILADFTVDCTSYEESALTLLIAYNIFFVFFPAGCRRRRTPI